MFILKYVSITTFATCFVCTNSVGVTVFLIGYAVYENLVME